MLEQFGFPPNFTTLIGDCITHAKFSILLNGAPFGFFSAGGGIRQGDPMSPALFTLFLDLLSRILTRAHVVGRPSSIKVSQTSPKITHLMYADDLVMYCKATGEEAAKAILCLQTYYQ